MKLILAFAASLLIIIGIIYFWPDRRYYISDREQQAFLDFYEKNLSEGMTRQQVQAIIDGHKSQPRNALFVEHPPYGSISTPLGEVPGPWYCSREVAYLQFNFNSSQRDSHGRLTQTGIDTFSDVKLLQELQDCL